MSQIVGTIVFLKLHNPATVALLSENKTKHEISHKQEQQQQPLHLFTWPEKELMQPVRDWLCAAVQR